MNCICGVYLILPHNIRVSCLVCGQANIMFGNIHVCGSKFRYIAAQTEWRDPNEDEKWIFENEDENIVIMDQYKEKLIQ